MSLPASWTALIAAPDLPAALFDHLAPAFATTPENRVRLRQICATAKRAWLDASHAEERYHSLEIELAGDRLRCMPPGDPDPALPGSFRAILALHRRLQLVDAQVDLFHEADLEFEGWLDGTDLADRGVYSPLRVYANLYIYHPDARAPSGEPALYVLDHETMEDDGPRPAAGDLPTVFLTQLANKLVA